MKKTSIWRDTSETTSFDCLNGSTVCDVAIVGGGITGITAAYLLGKQGIKSVVLEALKVGGGTTGFSTGNLYATVDEYLQNLQSKYDIDKVKAVVKARQKSVDLIRSLVNEFAIDCELVNVPFYLYTADDKKSEFIEKEHQVANEAGLIASFESEIGLPFPIKKAMKLDGQVQFNPMKYIKQLSKSIQNKFCTIYEGTKVLDYEFDDGAYTINCSQGTVRARRIILATHSPKGVLGIHFLLYPYREYAVAFEHKGPYVPGIFWGIDNENKYSIRHYQQEDQNYILVLGEKHKTGQEEHNLQNIENLKQYARERFSTGALAYQWGAQHYRASDGLPTVGKPDKNAEVYIATGFSTDGLTYGTMAAQMITDMITGKENPDAEVFSPHRHHPIQSAGQFIKENVNVLMQYMKDFPGVADVDEAEEVATGEGKIISQGGEKLAVYRGQNNILHVCSAVCTHMDCIVNWNEAESSWDCPCHGSRFNFDGTVLEGPAISDLPKRKITKP